MQTETVVQVLEVACIRCIIIIPYNSPEDIVKRILNIYIPTIILLFALLTLVACSEPNEKIEENIPASERGIGEVTM